MTTRKRETADVTGIRQRGERFQVRIPAASTRPPASSWSSPARPRWSRRDRVARRLPQPGRRPHRGTDQLPVAECCRPSGRLVRSSRAPAPATPLLIDKFILPALAMLGPRPYERRTRSCGPVVATAPGSRSSNTARRGGTSATTAVPST